MKLQEYLSISKYLEEDNDEENTLIKPIKDNIYNIEYNPIKLTAIMCTRKADEEALCDIKSWNIRSKKVFIREAKFIERFKAC